jgi:hypothetical protein
LSAASSQTIMGLSVVSLQMTLVQAQTLNSHKLLMSAKWEMLTHFSCLVLAEQGSKQEWDSEHIFLLENIKTFFKILTLAFI